MLMRIAALGQDGNEAAAIDDRRITDIRRPVRHSAHEGRNLLCEKCAGGMIVARRLGSGNRLVILRMHRVLADRTFGHTPFEDSTDFARKAAGTRDEGLVMPLERTQHAPQRTTRLAIDAVAQIEGDVDAPVR